MRIDGTRFGVLEFDEGRLIEVPKGLIGFPSDRRFILLEPPEGRIVAWLQAVDTPELAFPVVAGIVFGPEYPTPGVTELARRAQLVRSAGDAFTTLVVVAAPRGAARIANLLAPIVVNVDARIGAQVILDADAYSARAPFELSRVSARPPAPRGPSAHP
jgi:flagellar assembly factor FliW